MARNWERVVSDEPFKRNIVLRSRLINQIRQSFLSHGFLELDTPIMVTSTEFEPFFNPFVTHFTSQSGNDLRTFLVTSPELKMKMAVAAGFEKIFQISKFFRNGDLGVKHNPEFLGVEWYQTNTNYQDQMTFIENLIHSAVGELLNTCFTYQGVDFDFTPPWPRVTFQELILKHSGVDVLVNKDKTSLFNTLTEMGLPDLNETSTWEELVERLLVTKIDSGLGWQKPLFVVDYPNDSQFSLMAKTNPNDARSVERFELYIAGMEIAGGYSELNDPIQQQVRFENTRSFMRGLGKQDLPEVPLDYLRALQHLPDTSGVAIGLDRLAMFFCDTRDIRDVLLFPFSEDFTDPIS